MTARVLVVGDVITDIVVVPEGPLARGTDTRATIRQMPGGAGANQAVWLAAMGVDAQLAARVGAGDATRLARYFEGQGVAAHLGADDGLPTGTLICLVDPDGERSFLTDRGANGALSADDVPFALLDGIDCLHVSGYALFESGPRGAVLALMAEARARNIPVSVDPASSGFLAEVGPANFLSWIVGADIFFPNADEAALLTGSAEVETQLARLNQAFATVVLKRGAEGAIVSRADGERLTRPALTVDARDSTGAGDAFLAGYLAAKLRGEETGAALDAAIAAGARAVTKLGAQP